MCIRLAGDLFKTSDFIQCQKVILAVSGGSDSLALLFLVKDHFKTLSAAPEIIAVTVDHQLRRESAREALTVAEICHAHRIKHSIVRWEGEKPKTHIASSARMARYNLLFEEAQKQGATLIMTGHTLNDQVETYQMRYQRLQKDIEERRQPAVADRLGGNYARASAGVLSAEVFEGMRGRTSSREGEEQSATLIMTGHTLNDQVETYQMRYQRLQKDTEERWQPAVADRLGGGYARASADVLSAEVFEGMRGRTSSREGEEQSAQKMCLMAEKDDGLMYARGLSCIPRESLLCREIRLIRPLLGVKRQTLRTYLHLKGKRWIDDPTNEDRNFERVRVRQSLQQKKQSLQQKKFVEIGQRVHEAALKRRQQVKIVADLILALDIAVAYGRCVIAKPASFLQQHPSFPFVVGLFAVLMGGGSYLLPAQKLKVLAQKLCLHASEKQRFTLAGAVIESNRSGIALWRESRNMKEEIVESGKTSLWDGRYQITNHGGEPIKVGAAGLTQLKALLQKSALDLENPHFPSLQSLLMLSNDKGYAIPELISQNLSFPNVHIKRIMAPFDWLLSREDAALVHVVEPFFNIEVER
ncbi:tRNA lysidine(34) synthetase TilS [Bartonella machadoae]|uniref:tRNA lysidine(34) synthetase TilS n=1 Tax=Bartonella machadoae TaxID=2893471 RepID=UPI001F4CA10F|nr:tRNA lysidine(34) synthetase TilS [Bartonella machadoae]UNE53986.1 tRNA lysidine(34) synthetase TilS [Bartonella machadoae]